MAKAGFWLKGARGKLAGSVLQKSAGVGTIIRENVTPKNPRTKGQAVQRATFAPVAKFYSAFSKALEQSWEGLSKSESYRAFLKQGIADCSQGGWWVPKGTGFFPMPFQVSKGSLMTVDYDCETSQLKIAGTEDNETYGAIDLGTVGGLSQVFINLGYNEGQQVTFIIAAYREGSGYYPIYGRFIIEPENLLPFTLDQNLEIIKESLDPIQVSGINGTTVAAGAIIISNYEDGKWRRSTQVMAVDEGVMAAITSPEAFDDSTQSYRDAIDNSIRDSQVYLNDGEGASPAAASSVNNQLIVYGEYVGEDWDPTVRHNFWAKSLGTWKNPIAEGAVECLVARGKLDSPTAYETRGVSIKIGDDWVLSKTTKSPTRPVGVSEKVHVINGNDEATKKWLISKGVDPSLF